ncbi:MAG TPA: J domain-containing protein [Acidimicrobiales bacterium]|nr:J domain-containing protein [Acidimicrobiales bacterium]
MSRTRTHYQVLGIAEDASIEQIRRAYRALVRRYHPDHLGDRATNPHSKAEAEHHIRELNAAWQELRDPERRAHYDRRIAHAPREAPYDPFPPGTEPEPPGGFEEWYADAARRRTEARTISRPSAPARPFRVRLLIGFGVIVLIGIMLIVLITGESGDSLPPAVGQGRCVRVETGPHTVEVPCDQRNDGKILGQVDVPGECPNGAVARRLSAQDSQITCLDESTR